MPISTLPTPEASINWRRCSHCGSARETRMLGGGALPTPGCGRPLAGRHRSVRGHASFCGCGRGRLQYTSVEEPQPTPRKPGDTPHSKPFSPRNSNITKLHIKRTDRSYMYFAAPRKLIFGQVRQSVAASYSSSLKSSSFISSSESFVSFSSSPRQN
jgi:hypothetical protein